MYHKFSKLAKFSIIFSIVLTSSVIIYHGYNVHRMIQTNRLIFDKMEEKKVLRETAIQYLENEGAELFLGDEFLTIAGIILGILALFSLYKYSMENGFFFAIAASFLCLFTTFISGLLLFFVIFSGKSEIQVESGERTFKTAWERFINKKSGENRPKETEG